MYAIDGDPELKGLSDLEGQFGVYMRNRAAQDRQNQEAVEPLVYAIQAYEEGAPELAEAAATYLQKHSPPDELDGRKSGFERACVGEILWGTHGPGRGILRWHGEGWRMLDWQDQLKVPEELDGKLLGPERPPEAWERKSVCC